MTQRRALGISALLILSAAALACRGAAHAAVSEADKKVGIVECTDAVVKNHNPDLADNTDRLICFEGYVTNFNTKAVKIGNKDRFLGVPHWVSHHVKRAPDAPESGERPSTWFTVPELAAPGMAPSDASYQFSSAFKKKHANWYDRGHLAQKYLAERLGHDAAWFTHNVVNAVPQRHQFNAGSWLTLECYTGA